MPGPTDQYTFVIIRIANYLYTSIYTFTCLDYWHPCFEHRHRPAIGISVYYRWDTGHAVHTGCTLFLRALHSPLSLLCYVSGDSILLLSMVRGLLYSTLEHIPVRPLLYLGQWRKTSKIINCLHSY